MTWACSATASRGARRPRTEFRTAPLWGIRDSAPYLHDGRAATLDDAIAAHDGEAKSARDRFVQLRPNGRAAVIQYLRSP